MFDVFMLGVLFLVLLLAAGEIWALVKWRGAWRVAGVLAGVPLWVAIARILIDTSTNPTAHNLWFFEVTWWAGLGLAFLSGLALTRRYARR
jgi:hypothetical protein